MPTSDPAALFPWPAGQRPGNQNLWVPGGVWLQSWNLKELREGHHQEWSLQLNLTQHGKPHPARTRKGLTSASAFLLLRPDARTHSSVARETESREVLTRHVETEMTCCCVETINNRRLFCLIKEQRRAGGDFRGAGRSRSIGRSRSTYWAPLL